MKQCKNAEKINLENKTVTPENTEVGATEGDSHRKINYGILMRKRYFPLEVISKYN